MNNGVANAVVRCARDRVAGWIGGGGQGGSSLSGHGPVVNTHKTLFRRITVYRDEVKFSQVKFSLD